MNPHPDSCLESWDYGVKRELNMLAGNYGRSLTAIGVLGFVRDLRPWTLDEIIAAFARIRAAKRVASFPTWAIMLEFLPSRTENKGPELSWWTGSGQWGGPWPDAPVSKTAKGRKWAEEVVESLAEYYAGREYPDSLERFADEILGLPLLPPKPANKDRIAHLTWEAAHPFGKGDFGRLLDLTLDPFEDP